MKKVLAVLAISTLCFAGLSSCDEQPEELTPFDELRDVQATDDGDKDEDGKPD